ncbi:MAG: hypothetical protein ACK56R_01445 [Pirellulaceae bacterium]
MSSLDSVSHPKSMSLATGISSPWWRSPLLWKELRQVAPLAIFVFLFGGGLLLLTLVAEAYSGRLNAAHWTGHLMPWMSLPIFFATGVGALLVGSEKDSRTLQWLQSLPISAKQIAWNKTIAILLSLGMVAALSFLLWLLSGVLHGVWPLTHPSASMDTDSRWMFAINSLVSLFLAFAGFAFAWRFQSSFVALAMLVPASLLVWLTAYGISWFFDYSRPDLGSRSYFGTLLVATVGLAVDSWRQSQRYLGVSPGGADGFDSWRWLFPWKQPANAALLEEQGVSWLKREPVAPLTGMLWQTIRQYRLWWGAVALFGIAAIIASSRIPYDTPGYLLPLSRYDTEVASTLLYLLGVAVCWLGVFAYQGENIRDRVRFYADRGVSPRLLWVTRHWVPLLLLIGLTLVRYLARGFSGLSGESLLPAMRAMDAGRFLVIGLAIYSVGQWVSQCVNSPVVATVLATVVANAMIFYYLFAVLSLEAPWWLLPVPPLLFFVATAWLMQPWMERKIDWRFKLQQVAWAAVALAIPLVPGTIEIWNMPRMKGEVRQELTALAGTGLVQGRLVDRLPKSINYYADAVSLESVPGDVAANETSRRQLRADLIQRGWDAATVNRWLGRGGIRIGITEMISLRKQLEAEEQSEGTQGATSQTEYRSMLSHFPKLIRDLRATGTLRLCDEAEQLEVALLHECRLAESRQRMGDRLFSQVAQVLGESDQRDQARKVALAIAWMDLQQSRKVGTTRWGKSPGGYAPDQFFRYGSIQSGGLTSLINNIRMMRASELWAQDLWDLLKLSGAEDRKRARVDYTNNLGLFLTPPDLYDDLVWLGGDATTNSAIPCQHWRGDWEEAAKALAGMPSRSMQSETEVESGS